jgi:hypothetical protein
MNFESLTMEPTWVLVGWLVGWLVHPNDLPHFLPHHPNPFCFLPSSSSSLMGQQTKEKKGRKEVGTGWVPTYLPTYLL